MLRVFKMLVAEPYARKEKVAETECPIREEEKGTLRYTGGSVVKKSNQNIFGSPRMTVENQRLQHWMP